MKSSDLLTSASERQKESQGLLHTEMTDAVNSGLVDSADKSASTLKGKTTNKNISTLKKSDTVKKTETGGTQSVAHGAVDTVVYKGTSKVFDDTELEGVDDLYYKGRLGVRAIKKVHSSHSASSNRRIALNSRDGASPSKPLGTLSEKGSVHKAVDPLAKRRQIQAASYIKRSIYSTMAQTKSAARASVSAAKGLTTIMGGGLKGALAALGGTPLSIVLGLFLFILLISSLAGAVGGSNKTINSPSLTATENQVASFLMGKGLDALHTAAIMGNMYAESNINPSAVESGGTGIGICQWSFGRANNLREYAAQQGKNWDDLNVQLDFFWDHDEWSNEWSGTYALTSHQADGDPMVGALVSGSKSGFLATNDLSDAVKQFCYGWERPGIPRINVRLEAAQRYYAALTTTNTPGYIGGGQDYASAEQWQKNIVDACHRIPSPGASLCATWTTRVYAAAGYTVFGNGNNQLGDQGFGASYYPSRATTDLSQIRVGMLVSAQRGWGEAGLIHGHVAIYIGDGMVMESTGGEVRTTPLSDFVSLYSQRGWVVCGYPWDWR